MTQQAIKTTLVTGGSGGLGREMAMQLATQGHDLVITYHSNTNKANEVVAQIEALGRRARALQLDVSQINNLASFNVELKQTLADWGKSGLDYLVNNAGIGIHAPIGNTAEADFDRLMNIHFKGVYFLTENVLLTMNDGGGIVNVSTGLTRFALPGYAAYASMKGAVEVFTKYLAKELGERRIKANLVAPGAIDNEFNAAAFDHNPQIREFIAGQTALGRVGQSTDIGGVVAFLCSEAGAWVNAQRIEASGGMFL